MSIVAYNDRSIQDVTEVAGIPVAMVLISSATASNSASISFTSGLDDTYPVYMFKFINIDPATNNERLTFNLSIDGGSNYNVTKTTSFFDNYHGEDGAGGVLRYVTAGDLAQSTGDQRVTDQIGNTDSAGAAMMHLFNPSDTTFVKHFFGVGQSGNGDSSPPFQINNYFAGYANTTSAINAIRFQMGSGNIASGTIKMYGIKDS